MAAQWLRFGTLAMVLGTGACSSGTQAEGRPQDDGGAAESGTGADASAPELALDGATDAAGDASVSACNDFANAYCQRYQSCDSLAFALAFGDVSLCVARISPWCENQFGAPGGTLTVSAREACTGATAAQSCATFFSDNPPECSWSGTEEAGAPCAYSLQCANGFCLIPANTFCGTCLAPLQSGDSCDPNAQQCANGLVCGKVACPASGGTCPGAAQWQCVSPGAGVGEPCTNWAACAWPIICDGTQCIQPPGLGASCDPTGLCDDTQNLYCAASSDAGGRTCDKATYVPAGMACDLSASQPQLCLASASCRSVTGTPTLVGTCAAAAADGQSCANALCVPPSICVNGTCQAPAAASSCN